MSIAEEIAVDTALSHVISILQDNLASALSSSPVAVVGLELPAPADQAYYLQLSPQYIDRQVHNDEVMCVVYQESLSDMLTQTSGTPTHFEARQATYAEIVIGYRMRMQEPLVRDGKTYTSHDIMALRGYRYLAGITQVMRKYGCNSTAGVSQVQKMNDLVAPPILNEDDQPIMGFVSAVWGLHQEISVPRSVG